MIAPVVEMFAVEPTDSRTPKAYCTAINAAPSATFEASHMSAYALNWYAPRPTKAGMNERTTSRTWSDAVSKAGRTPPVRRMTVGTCTRNWSAHPSTDPQAAVTARRSSCSRGPYTRRATMMQTFQMTGET